VDVGGKPHRETYPSLVEAVFLLAALFALEYLLSAVLRDAGRAAGLHTRDVVGAVSVFANGVLFTWVLYYKRLSYRELFHPSRHSVAATLGTLSVPILLIVPAFVLAMSVLNLVVVSIFPMSRWDEVMFERMMSSGIASVVATCILAPLLEEMLFRGIMLRAFLRQYSTDRAIVYSAVLFGAAHLNIYQFFVGISLGLVAGWVYARARSLWPCILLHAAYNGAVTYQHFNPGTLTADVLSSAAFGWSAAAMGAGLIGTLLLRRVLR
jgi:uncharacterized protein